MKFFLWTMCLLFSCSISNQLHAHELSTSFVSAHVDDFGKLSGQLKVKVLDLKDAVKVDVDNNGELTWGEIKSSQSLIYDHISRHFSFSRNNNVCPLRFDSTMLLQKQASAAYIVMPFWAQCDTVADLQLNYRLFFDLFANHKAIVSVSDQHNEYLSVVTNGSSPAVFNVDSSNRTRAFFDFVYQGILHILIGLDHILFLLTLLLTVCLYRGDQKWRAIESKSTIIKRTLWIVTSFTIAHSITLTGTALGFIPQFGSWIEVVIAVSILFNVLNNLFPLVTRLGFITFAFGLIHGMGFAGALAEIGLPENHKLLTVLAFNTGVELGQMGLLLIWLPILISARFNALYQCKIMPLMSIVIGALAIYWIITRL